MKSGNDGARDHNGELLPELSASATKMNYERLVNAPLPKFKEKYPDLPSSWNLVIFASEGPTNQYLEHLKLQESRKSLMIEGPCAQRGTLMA